MGGGESLSEYTNDNLIENLRKFPTTNVFLAKVDSDFVGLAVCFEGFSTFNCQRLLNIHDFVIHPKFRRKGVGFSLLMFVDHYSRNIGCCKLTLEVLEGNHAARALYAAAGFESYELDADTGHALFWQKKLK
jgi:ribosomal protein S18 acetylase RimI-like enzyme